jgi:hypothetical protein
MGPKADQISNTTVPMKVFEEKIRSHLRLTKTEGAALTGISIDQSEGLLRDMLTRYECRLQVTENGDIIYDFGNSLHRRGDQTLREYLQDFWEKFWQILTYIYKASITVMLVAYCLVFVVALLALELSQSSNNNSRSSSSGAFNLIGNIFLAIFEWNTISSTAYNDPYYSYSIYRNQYQQPKRIPERIPEKKGKGIIPSVYDFVFGPPRVKPDKLARLRQAAAFIRRNNDILVTSDVKALVGTGAGKAAGFFSECIARFGGDIKVSKGIMYGQFDQLERTVNSVQDSEVTYYWDQYEPEYPLTGNSILHNFIIAIVNSFNLLVSGSVILRAIPQLVKWPILLGWIPFIFSLLFFLIPLWRAIKAQLANPRRKQENIRKQVMKIIFQMKGAAISVDDLCHKLSSGSRSFEQFDRSDVEKTLKQLHAELPGDIVYRDNGELLYAFPIIEMELNESASLRKNYQPDKNLGNIVFDSDK